MDISGKQLKKNDIFCDNFKEILKKMQIKYWENLSKDMWKKYRLNYGKI